MVAAKYIAITNELRKEVQSGRYGIEGGLPPVQELAKKYGAVVNTVKVALQRLAGEKVIVQKGQNYYVNNVAVVMTQYVPLPVKRYPGGYVKTLYMQVERLPEPVAHQLGVSDKTSFPVRGQISGIMEDGKEAPLQITHRYYLLSLSEEQSRRLEQEPDWDPLGDIRGLLDCLNELDPRIATSQEAKQFDVPEGTPVQSLWEVIKDLEGNVLMAQELTLSPRKRLIYNYRFENNP